MHDPTVLELYIPFHTLLKLLDAGQINIEEIRAFDLTS